MTTNRGAIQPIACVDREGPRFAVMTASANPLGPASLRILRSLPVWHDRCSFILL
jgi:hypothetical protein